jgi:hypothetical protein
MENFNASNLLITASFIWQRLHGILGSKLACTAMHITLSIQGEQKYERVMTILSGLQ